MSQDPDKQIEAKFSDWFNEIEGFALRGERFYDELDHLTSGGRPDRILEWLKAAYREGYLQARYDTMKLYWDDGK